MTLLGGLFLFVICAYLPFVALRSARRMKTGTGKRPTRKQYITAIFFWQGLFLVLALAVNRSERVVLFPPFEMSLAAACLAAIFFALAVAVFAFRWRRKPLEERAKHQWMRPQGPRDLWWWALASLAAGTIEEIVYRGMAMALWVSALQEWCGLPEVTATAAAVCICVAAFALVHAHQGRAAMWNIAGLALAMHVLVFLNGNLYAAMAVHTAYDFAVGVIVSRSKQSP